MYYKSSEHPSVCMDQDTKYFHETGFQGRVSYASICTYALIEQDV